MRSFDEAWAAVADIDGWLTEGQARMLYGCAPQVPAGSAVVEVGSHHGRSTVILGSAIRPGVELVAVDPFDDARWGGGDESLNTFRANLARNQIDARVVRAYGADAGRSWSGPPVGLLFLDGAHDYESVTADLQAWIPHLAPEATVLMHDAYSSPGVTRAAFRHMFASREFHYRGASRSLVRFDRGEGSRLVSAGRMLARLPWFARNIAVKVARRQGWPRLERALGHRDASMPF